MHRLSVIIANYNYERFVGAAISSALAVDWPDVEVIVVDDGSTDASRAVIEGFGAQITAIFKANAGQREACNTGFAASSGDVVVFLDSDDQLEPAFAREVAGRWHEGVSKVQVQMTRVDAENVETGSITPAYPREPSAAEITKWAAETTAYPTPPGSGNAYSRAFLERLMPIDDSVGAFADSACLAAAPFFGDVETIAKPLVRYRVHGANDSNLLANPERFGREVDRARARFLYSLRLQGAPLTTRAEDPLYRSRELLQFRVAAERSTPGARALPHDSRVRMLADAILAPIRPGYEPPKMRLMVAGWSLATLLAPRRFVPRLLAIRYAR